MSNSKSHRIAILYPSDKMTKLEALLIKSKNFNNAIESRSYSIDLFGSTTPAGFEGTRFRNASWGCKNWIHAGDVSDAKVRVASLVYIFDKYAVRRLRKLISTYYR